MSSRFARKISLVEFLVAVTAITMVIAVLPASISLSQQTKKLTACASNLRTMGHLMYIYAQDGDLFPASSVTRKENDGAMVLFAKENRTSAPSTTSVPSPTVDLWMLLRANQMPPAQFICPMTKDTPDPAQDVMAYYDFLTSVHLSYAYQYQYDPNRKIMGTASEPIFPMAADANPYIKGGVKVDLAEDRKSNAAGNSLNHGEKRPSQNVLFQDSHVSLENSPDVGSAGLFDSAIKKSRGRDNAYSVHKQNEQVDPGSAAPTSTNCNLGDKSDACLVP